MSNPRVEIMIKRNPGTEDIPLPEYMTEHAAGMDVAAAVTETLTIEPGKRAIVPTGFKMAIPPGFEAQIRPRSGLAAKNGISVPNSPGTIDADYRGDVGVILINLGQEPFEITRGMRIAQMVITEVEMVDIKTVDELPATDRGEGGFGSTGHKV